MVICDSVRMPDDPDAGDEQSVADRPSLVLDRASYPRVETAHIVPRMYQKAFAVDGKVAVHTQRNLDCVLRSTKIAGTRPAFYRRARPDGEQIDDVEACLAAVEDKAAPPLKDVIAGGPLTVERKGVLAQFVCPLLQMLR